ncbi:MAG: type secretory pathway, ATPase PulE/Tfp pilus assembly pathway, ATPase PilB [Dehalococcoidales bacterium]|nr:type secretory pathway, ATPase PulE/Tfp pilus assembly pathway, ATPase PilB [Dehalococcoidales bacterium]
MKVSEKSSSKDLGQMLVEAKLLTEQQLDHIKEVQAKDGSKIERILLQERLITPQQLAFFTSLQLRIPFVNLRKEGVRANAVALVPEPIARKYNAIPIDVSDNTLVLAMEDPSDIQAIEELATLTRKRIEPVLSTFQDIQEMIDLTYRVGGEIEEQLSKIPTRFQKARVTEARVSAEAIAQAPVVRAIDLLIKQAVRDRASDIHIEPQEDRLRVRYRIDGMLHEVMSLPLSVHPPLLSRVKIMATHRCFPG